MKQTSRKVSILCLLIASILWSTGGLLIKWVDWNPIAIAGIRSGISSLVMIVFWFVLTKKLPKKPDKFVLFGAFNYVILVMLFVSANKLTTSANAILLQFTAPIFVYYTLPNRRPVNLCNQQTHGFSLLAPVHNILQYFTTFMVFTIVGLPTYHKSETFRWNLAGKHTEIYVIPRTAGSPR